jgi:hypothetical protein
MTVEFEVLDYIPQLRRVGPRPPEKLVQRILALGSAAVEPLLELAIDQDALYEEPPICYAPIHALRLLGELRATEMIGELLAAYPMDEGLDPDERSPATQWDADLPQVLGSWGTDAIELLWAFVDDERQEPGSHDAALSSLAYTTTVAPEQRADIVAGLRSRLQAAEDATMAAYLVMALGNIGAPDAYPEVMALFKAGKIDRELISPATTRQLLLSDGTKRLACSKHPFWERYDQHGPFPPR